MEFVNYQCHECRKKVTANIGQTVINLELRWYISYKCSYCESCVEFDDIGFPPSNIRKSFIAEEGEWQLVIDQSDLNNQPKLLKVLRKALNLSIYNTMQLKKNLPDVARGTQVEMKWLQEILQSQMIKSSVQKIKN